MYVSINVMPSYHRYRLRWGLVAIYILENYNSPPIRKAQTPTTLAVNSPTNSDLPPTLACI